MPGSQSLTDGGCGGLLSGLQHTLDGDHNSIPDLLSISDSNTQSESRHSMPDLESVVESDYESSTVGLLSIIAVCPCCSAPVLLTKGDCQDGTPGQLSHNSIYIIHGKYKPFFA